MSLQISAESAVFESEPKVMSTVIASLSAEGYKPLLQEARRRFLEALTISGKSPTSASAADHRERPYPHTLLTGMLNERIPVAGDVFAAEGSAGLLYLLLYDKDGSGSEETAEQATRHLEAGCIGSDYVVTELQDFLVTLAVVLKQVGVKVSWSGVQSTNPRFMAVSQNKDLGFESGDSMTDEEVQASTVLGELHIREFADALKRSGQMLAADVKKEDSGFVPKLEDAKLLAKEYVVICRQTLNQINRVAHRERVEQMSQMGVLCSCGSPIGSEKVEELLLATPLLRRMLDRNYWTSAKLVEALRRFGIPADKSLFALHDGVMGVDALVDLDGKLLLLELQDDKFSTRDAYRFAARMGAYKPDYAFVVATRGFAPGAKEQFSKMGTEGEMTYVTTLAELSSELARVVDEIRSARASEIFQEFEVLSDIGVPLQDIFLERIREQAAGKAKLGPQPVPIRPAVAKVLP